MQSSISKSDFQKFSEKERLAYLINAYNAFTIKLVLDYYPVSSIRDIKGDFATPWDKKFFSLLETRRSLNELEHEIIRKKYNEPRIHFALVCAARGCPALKDEAYQASKLDDQLDRSTAKFLADKSRNYYDEKTKTLYLSEIFSWYKSDFTKSHKSLPAFIARYLPEIENNHAQISVDFSKNKYDWSLNDASEKRGLASFVKNNFSESVVTMPNTGNSGSPSVANRGPQGQYGPPTPKASGSSHTGSGTESRPSYSSGGGGDAVGSGTESSGSYSNTSSPPGVPPSSGYSNTGSGPETPPPSGTGGYTGSGSEKPPTSSPPTVGSGTETASKFGQTDRGTESSGPVGSGTESSYQEAPTAGSGTKRTGSGTESVRSGTEGYRSVRNGTESVGSGTETASRFDDQGRSIGAITSSDTSFDSRTYSSSSSVRESPASSFRNEHVSTSGSSSSTTNAGDRTLQTRTVGLEVGQREHSLAPRSSSSTSRTLVASDSRSSVAYSDRRLASRTRSNTTQRADRDRAGAPRTEKGNGSTDEEFRVDTVADNEVLDKASKRDDATVPRISAGPPLLIEKSKADLKVDKEKPIAVPDKITRKKVIAVKLLAGSEGQAKEQIIYIEQEKPISQEELRAMIKEIVEVLQKLGRIESVPLNGVEVATTTEDKETLGQYQSVMISTRREQKKVFIPEQPDEELASDTDDSEAAKRRKKRNTGPAGAAPAI